MTRRRETVTSSRKEVRGNPSVIDRSGIDYLGQYGGPKAIRERIRSYGNRQGLVIDYDNYDRIREFTDIDLVPERDNKSVWSPKDLLAPLLKFGDGVPVELVRRICSLENGKSCSMCSKGEYSKGDGPEECAVNAIAADFSSSSGRGHRSERFDEGAYGWAVNSVRRMLLNGEKVTPLSVEHIIDNVLHDTSTSGAPWFKQNKEVDRDELIKECYRTAIEGKALPPFVASSRTQHGEKAPKGRLIWAAGLVTTVLASRYSKAVYEKWQKKFFLSFGDGDQTTGAKLVSMHSRKRWVYGLDFSAFDASLSAHMIDSAFGIIKEALDLSEVEAALFDRVVSDFIHSRLILPDGSMWRVHRGVPSGSAFTSLVDSICNLIILQYIWIRKAGHPLSWNEVCVLGDDSVTATDWYSSMDEIQEVAQELGIILSTQKSARVGLGGAVPYLGHWWKCGQSHRDEREIAIRQAFPERWNQFLRDPRYSLLRRISYMADCVEGYQFFYKTKWKTSPNVEQEVLNEVFSIDLPSLMPLLSAKETRGALTGRQEYLMRVEGKTIFQVQNRGFSMALVHAGRSTQ